MLQTGQRTRYFYPSDSPALMSATKLLPRLTLAAVLGAATLTAAFAFTPDGIAHGGGLRLLGRLHPLLVHFPIALLLLVPILEILGRRRAALRETAGTVLTLSLFGAILSVFAGLALMRADGHEGATLENHLWGGVTVAIATALAWISRGRSRTLYALSLAASLSALAWAAHQGGSLTHGEDYLTEPLPPAVKKILRIREKPEAEIYASDTVFGGAVRPILEKHCFSCHAADKEKGDYRMDTFAALLAGGKSGKPAVTPGDITKSELLQRILLDPSDEKVMPPKKKARPTPAEIALIRWWIKQGASRETLIASIKEAPLEISALLAGPSLTVAAPAAPTYQSRVGDYSALRGQIAVLEKKLHVKITPVSTRAGDGLALQTRGAEQTFGDAELAALAPLAAFIVEAELGGTRLTDASLATLKTLVALERLNLERTALTGSTLGELRSLKKISYLNLCSTAVTDDTLAELSGAPTLRQLYLFGSKATPAGLTRLRAALPKTDIGDLASP